MDVTTVDTDELVAWLRQAVEDQHAESMADVAELGGWMEIYDPKRPTDEALAAALLAEVEAKRARIDVLADALECGDGYGAPGYAALQDTAQRLLMLEAQPLASRPGFRDDWRLT